MSELPGLTAILNNGGTLHTIEAPPTRGDFKSRVAYERAYRDWYARVHYWRVVSP